MWDVFWEVGIWSAGSWGNASGMRSQRNPGEASFEDAVKHLQFYYLENLDFLTGFSASVVSQSSA